MHGWTHIISDVAIFCAYIAIPIALACFVRRRTDVPFPRVFWLFVGFITFCGFAHLIEATIFWRPWYRLSAALKVGTAIVSWATVIAMFPVIPRALRFRSPAELEAEVTCRTQQLSDVNDLLRDKNDELEQFIYTVSHDLKSPLVTARGFLGALREDLGPIDNQDVHDSMQRIDRATQRMGQLLDDLLELSRIGRVRNDPEWIDMEVLIDEVRKELEPILKSRHRRVVLQGRLPKVYADAVRIRQVFDNLLSNAVSYGTTDDCPEVTVSGSADADGCEFRVTDHGPGIPIDQRDRVFFPFERLATDREGTGVGLAIVARILAVQRGAVRIEDTPGGGVTFVVSMPAPSPHEVKPMNFTDFQNLVTDICHYRGTLNHPSDNRT